MEQDSSKWVPGAITYVNNPRDVLLVEREKTHGAFCMTAKVACEIREAFMWGPKELKPAQREALTMIATKIGRIVCGDPNNVDSWNDIAGYAKLGAEACK